MASSSSRVSSEHEDDHPSSPSRLSALYQYHNAPEVAPAHGLEYDDTIYPVSDKFPVIKETLFHRHNNYTGKHAYENDNRPPRIIFGMKVKTFLIVAAIMILVIVGAAVGGAVGGKNLHQGLGSQTSYGDMSGTGSSSSSSSPSPTTTKATTAAATTFSAPTPTYTALSDCPKSNDTTYTSQYSTGSQGSVPQGAGLTFTKYCDLQSPLTSPSATQIAEAFVYSFSDCVEVCAGYNFLNAASNCTFAVYTPGAKRPSNCWVGSADVAINSQQVDDGTDVAVLRQS